MNYKKAVGAGLLAFAIQFSLVNVLSNLIGPFLGNSKVYVYSWQAFMVLMLIAIVYFVSKWYFVGNKTSVLNGVILGVILVVTNMAITLAQAVPAAVLGVGQNVGSAIITYLTGWPFIITAIITIVASIPKWYGSSVDCNVKDAIGSCMPKDGDDKKECKDCKGGTCSVH